MIIQDNYSKYLQEPVFHILSETADELGKECYVIGGYVRDLLLERPSKDIDIVVVESKSWSTPFCVQEFRNCPS